MAGQKATCSLSLKKLSGLRFSTMRPTGCSGNTSSGHVLVTSKGSKSNLDRGEGRRGRDIDWPASHLYVLSAQDQGRTERHGSRAGHHRWAMSLQADSLVLVRRVHDLNAERPLGVIPGGNRIVQILRVEGRDERGGVRG